ARPGAMDSKFLVIVSEAKRSRRIPRPYLKGCATGSLDPAAAGLGMTKGLWTISFIIPMMQFHVRNGRDARNPKQTGNATRCFYSAIQQHDRSLDGCVADCVLRIRTGILGFDQRVRFDLTLGILRHARSARATEFQAYGHDLRGCDAVWKFLLFFPLWIGEFL